MPSARFRHSGSGGPKAGRSRPVCCRCLSPKASCSCVYAPTILAQPFPWPRSSTSLEIPCFAPSRLRNSTQESDHRTAPEQVPRKSMIRPTVPARAGSLAARRIVFREQGRERAGRCGRVFRLRRIACARVTPITGGPARICPQPSVMAIKPVICPRLKADSGEGAHLGVALFG